VIVKYCMCSGMYLINAHTCHYLTKFLILCTKGKIGTNLKNSRSEIWLKILYSPVLMTCFFYEVTKSIVIYICYSTPWCDSSPTPCPPPPPPFLLVPKIVFPCNYLLIPLETLKEKPGMSGGNKPSIKYDYKKMSEALHLQPIQYSCLSDTLPKYEVVVVM